MEGSSAKRRKLLRKLKSSEDDTFCTSLALTEEQIAAALRQGAPAPAVIPKPVPPPSPTTAGMAAVFKELAHGLQSRIDAATEVSKRAEASLQRRSEDKVFPAIALKLRPPRSSCRLKVWRTRDPSCIRSHSSLVIAVVGSERISAGAVQWTGGRHSAAQCKHSQSARVTACSSKHTRTSLAHPQSRRAQSAKHPGLHGQI